MHSLLVFVKLFLILNTCESSEISKVGLGLAYPEVRTQILAIGEELLNKSGSFIFENNFDEIHLTCTSKYPNKWTFASNPLYDGHSIFHIDKTRTADDINDESTYTFISTLVLRLKNPIISQNVSCSHPNRSKAAENYTTLVYLVTSPAKTKLLVRVEPGSQLKLKDGQNPRYGGNPNCDIVLHFDNVTQKYGCTYTGVSFLKPIPRVVPCNDNDECSAIIKMDNCTNSVSYTCPNDFDICKKIPPKSGALICEWNGKSVARSVYSTVEDPPTYYMRRENVNISQVLKGRISNKSIIYEGDIIPVSCYGAASFFTKGFHWAFQDENGTIEYVRPSQKSDNYSKERQMYISEMEIIPNHTQIRNVLCFAPVWNSYKYENISIPVNISEIPPPDLANTSNSKTVLVGESVTLECLLVQQNVPPVEFVWLKGGKTLQCSLIRANVNTTCEIDARAFRSKLFIRNNLDDANYTCKATNRKDVWREKQFLVRISSGTSTTKIILICSISGLVIFVLIFLLCILFRKIRSQNETIQNLSEDDISVFVHGDPTSDSALFYPYNVQYEISRKDFHIEAKVLGSGQFGVVLKGRLGKAPVAIKSVKKGADANYVKALLSELKIMSFVGRHENLVSLIGACTENISKCEVYVICEFCANGNVLKYIKDSREIFVDHNPSLKYGSFRKSTVDYQNSSVKKLSSKDLLRWAYEIACGMEYLSSKKVVHGDLAARNVLLTEDLTAKVGDFGLSKQLFQYSVYVQRQECPLPLRWMAIESLQDLEFSVQSDIWSYGITLWEIFTLGRTPYPGVSWDFECWKMLKNGYRMDKPQYASDMTYKMLLQCWDIDLNKRPDFTTLKEFFLGQCNLFANTKRSMNKSFK